MLFENFYKPMPADEKKKFAEKLKTSVAFLNQIANGHRNAGPKTVKKIVAASSGAVSYYELRPDIYPIETQQTE